MVRALLIAPLLAFSVASTSMSADWTSAGGALFVGGDNLKATRGPGTGAPLPLAQPFSEVIEATAHARNLDPKLLHALVLVESGYEATAVSRAGAMGLTQLMPKTAQELGVRDPFDPAENLAGGATYLAAQLERFGDLRLALAAYNAGPSRVAAIGAIPNIPETRSYVAKVIDCFLALAAGTSCARPAPAPHRSRLHEHE